MLPCGSLSVMTNFKNRLHSHRSLLVILIGAVASLALASATMFALGGFTATIANTGPGFASGTVVLQEAVGGSATTCFSTTTNQITTNSNNCTTINLFGTGNADPGTTNAATVTLTNVGTINASTFTLTPGACTAAANTATAPYYGSDTTGFCGLVDVTIENTTTAGSPTCVYPATTGACPAPSSTYTLKTLAANGPVSLGSLAAGSADTFVITSELDPSATNADQGLAATANATWELSQ